MSQLGTGGKKLNKNSCEEKKKGKKINKKIFLSVILPFHLPSPPSHVCTHKLTWQPSLHVRVGETRLFTHGDALKYRTASGFLRSVDFCWI